jgi:uroporphyrinogen-III synthase
LEQLGSRVDHVPLTAVAEASDGGVALAASLARLDAFDWLAVTSVNGAERVGAEAKTSSVRLAAVGDSTAATLEQLAGRRVDLVPSVPRVEGLLHDFPPGPLSVLVAQGNLASTDLVAGLRQRGHDVTAVEAYATVLRRPTEDELVWLGNADVVVLASGSAAASFARTNTTSAVVVAIGPVTAGAAADAGLRVAAVARTPRDTEVIAAVARSLT